MRRPLPSLLAAGVALALFELLLTWLRGRALFLTTREFGEYAVAALSGLSVLVLALGGALHGALRSRVLNFVFAALAGLGGGWAGWLLTAGRRVKDLSVRPLLVALFALLAATLVLAAVRFVRRALADETSSRRLAVAALAALAAGCVLADGHVLPRGYPAFHVLLMLLAAACSATAGVLLAHPVEQRVFRVCLGMSLLLPFVAPVSLSHLARQPNASFAVSEMAPLTAKLLRSTALLRARSTTPQLDTQPAAEQVAALPAQKGIDLRDRDVLLITVDALRADTLRSLGGSGLTPSIDELATQGVVFRRAYTPAPHTSYALASLLTAKFIKPVVELGSAVSDHATLPDLLQRYGYRTAAFYPPAIFFVDGARFAGLANRGFGFEYRKEMYASASVRVDQLRDYLEHVETGHPLFVWVHLFEPHEPYEPPAEFKQDESARGRYDGEVAYADHAIGRMTRLFRELRPHATVIVTADHGEEFGDHGGSFHGSTLFDEQTRVPVVWSSPGAVTPATTDVPIELVDVGSTILSSAGIARDPRMRGDDLGPVLLGNRSAGPRFAFASVEERHMVCDGRYKAICSPEQEHCQLFDLQNDAKEQHNLITNEPERAQALRRELFGFLSTIARREALAVQDGVGFPEPLVRARLGAPGAGVDVIPLLGDQRPLVRAASARVLGELAVEQALRKLEEMSRADTDEEVRAEAAVAALLLGGADTAAVAGLLAREEHTSVGLSVRRRAALALGAHQDARALPVLAELVRDEGAQEVDRLRAVHTLAKLRDDASEAALIGALDSVRLREPAADALALVGGAAAKKALFERFVSERYPPARGAEARALLALGETRALTQIVRFLGMETSLPDGVLLLWKAGQLRHGSARGAQLREAGGRAGAWTCEEQGCVPGTDASLRLPAASPANGRQRITLLVDAADAGALLRVGSETFELKRGVQQVALWREQSGPLSMKVSLVGRAHLIAWVSAPEAAEIPAPAPEPWDGGSPDASP